MGKKLLGEMTWEEAEVALKQCEVVIIPTGSHEQHGKALPLCTDWLTADAIGKRLADKVGENVVILPSCPFGYCDYHSDFAGTLSLSEETLTAFYSDILNYVLRYGVKRVIFANSHGANCGAIKNLSHKLRARNVLVTAVAWWDAAVAANPDWGLIGHADINETSLVMAIRPELVHMDKLQDPKPGKLSKGISIKNLYQVSYKGCNVTAGLRTRDCTDFGCMLEVGFEGSAEGANASVHNSSAERGRGMIEAVTDFIADFAEELKSVDLYRVQFPEEQYYL